MLARRDKHVFISKNLKVLFVVGSTFCPEFYVCGVDYASFSFYLLHLLKQLTSKYPNYIFPGSSGR